MSLALNARIKDLEARLTKVEAEVDVLRAEKAKSEVVQEVEDTMLQAIGMGQPAAKRKPGRPPKNG